MYEKTYFSKKELEEIKKGNLLKVEEWLSHGVIWSTFFISFNELFETLNSFKRVSVISSDCNSITLGCDEILYKISLRPIFFYKMTYFVWKITQYMYRSWDEKEIYDYFTYNKENLNNIIEVPNVMAFISHGSNVMRAETILHEIVTFYPKEIDFVGIIKHMVIEEELEY